MSEGKENIPALGLAAKDASGKMIKHKFFRRGVSANDVHIKIKYSGICHSDIHTAKDEWGPKPHPIVVGHEIIGDVVAVGSSVTKHKVGDVVGVGCFVDSCRKCTDCKKGEEQFCSEDGGMHGTYGVAKPESLHPGGMTMGGYSSDIVVDENYVLRIPANLNRPEATPLLCAGITCYSPFQFYGLQAGMTLGVVGLGGLGHMAVKIGKAMGANVTVFSRNLEKKEQALKLGATNYVVSTNEEEMKKAANTLDMIYDSIAVKHALSPYLACLRNSSTYIMVGGVPDTIDDVSPFQLIMKRQALAGSIIGGIRETQEMLDFCGKHNVVCDIELIKAEPEVVDAAWDRTIKGDVKFRFVIDTAATLKE
jgi:uncharacterized zinc-type alcohol dehydrogenase-like protein